ncbi:MAG: alpha/beta hydrolase [Actinobacteria bacterium]|nr:alpha/beta hydrolase [Actinomycetota bacterium]
MNGGFGGSGTTFGVRARAYIWPAGAPKEDRPLRNHPLATFAVTLALLLAGLGSIAPAASAAPPALGVKWSPCHRDLGPFDCGTVQVPLDYDAPNGATISLALIRLRATDPNRRIGSLFVNPGGPGGSGFDLVLFAGRFLFPPQVTERFDLVGFDPRGVARSTQLRCFGTIRQVFPYLSPMPFPITDQEEARWIENERHLVGSCDQRGGQIGEHMSTANVARDLDQLRQAVGDEQLTYYGVSYGSYLGTTYANLFPQQVRAVGVDSVLDPIAWANEGGTVPFSTRLRSDQSAMSTLREFFRLCDAAGARCAFGPSAEGRFEELAARLRQTPIAFPTRDGGTFIYGYAQLVGDSLGAMYESRSWQSFAGFLSFLDRQVSPSTVAEARDAFQRQLEYGTKRGFPRYPNFLEGLAGVMCADTDGPSGYPAWSAAADAAEAQFGHFGRIWTWISSPCAEWPFEDADRFAGPFTQQTAHPVLVVGNLFDPATGYHGAQTVAGLMPNSSLLTVAGWGHGSIGRSSCADEIIGRYLIDQVTPSAGTVCVQDFVPFVDGPPGPPGPGGG